LYAKANDKDLEEGTPDHPGEPLETAEVNSDSSPTAKPDAASPAFRPSSGETPNAAPGSSQEEGQVVQAAIRAPIPQSAGASPTSEPKTKDPTPELLPSTGTVILDVEQGGIEVPSFIGKTVRGAVEAAQDAGLELVPVGSGVARQQVPVAGTHVPAGSRVTVQFGK
jgi:cell division protein FtsI (penicillin-binding protein 3)